MNITIPEWFEKQNLYLKGFYFTLILMGISLFNNGIYALYIFTSLVYFWIGYLISALYTNINNSRGEKKSKLEHWWGEIVLFLLYLGSMITLMLLIHKGIF